ncbi:hypothetical protein NA56DRAFT_665220 [Hyaloscypha hepaticicola]|uniref:Terpenoid synthase n=1 Tax=Hyaloscypha hepaticicola TaxID=2082293 RepID=A0A2J6PIA8_9HELO|nr:hypothetical protein NA56DRAFT_665220 [Hyaloscypha hepaticicola]
MPYETAVYLHLVGDQFSIVNDIASYDEEYSSFKSDMAKHLLHVFVAAVQKVLGVPDSNTTKPISYALQSQTEEAINKELERMKTTGNLSDNHWKFVESVLMMAAGNVFTSV